jgi:hypothetical protein
MMPTRVRERLKQLEGRVERDEYYRALEYVHDDGR